MKTFRTLDLAVEFYKQTDSLKLTGNLRDQLTRACQTIFRLASQKDAELEKLADHLGACLYKLMKAENRVISDSV